jgi:hypothetical protein
MRTDIATLLETSRTELESHETSVRTESEALLRKLEYEVQCSAHARASLDDEVTLSNRTLESLQQRISTLVSESESSIEAHAESSRAQTSALVSSLENEVSKAQTHNSTLERDARDRFARFENDITTLLDTSQTRLDTHERCIDEESDKLLRKLEYEVQCSAHARTSLDGQVASSNETLESLRQRISTLVSESESSIEAHAENTRTRALDLISFLDTEIATAREHNFSLDQTKRELTTCMRTDIATLLETSRTELESHETSVRTESEALLRKLEYAVQCSESVRDSLDRQHEEATSHFEEFREATTSLLADSEAKLIARFEVIERQGEDLSERLQEQQRQLDAHWQSTNAATGKRLSEMKLLLSDTASQLDAHWRATDAATGEHLDEMKRVIADNASQLDTHWRATTAATDEHLHEMERAITETVKEAHSTITTLKEGTAVRLEGIEAQWKSDCAAAVSQLDAVIAARESALAAAESGRQSIQETASEASRVLENLQNDVSSLISQHQAKLSEWETASEAKSDELLTQLEDAVAQAEAIRAGLDDCLEAARTDEAERAVEFDVGTKAVCDEVRRRVAGIPQAGADD